MAGRGARAEAEAIPMIGFVQPRVPGAFDILRYAQFRHGLKRPDYFRARANVGIDAIAGRTDQ